jgi:ATP-dependent DNA helicase RecG
MTEHQNLEWKETWRDEYLRWLCGFANAQGGTLVIGKSDRGGVVGVKDVRKLLEDLPNKVRDTLGIMVDVNRKREAGLDLVEIVVEPYPYPISYKGEYHYRTGSTKQELKGAALDKFLMRKWGRHWDGVPVPGVRIKDLSRTALERYRKRARDSERVEPEILTEPASSLIERLRLKEGEYLKRAALLLFYPDPEKYVTGANVKIGFFRTNADLLYQDQVEGDLFTQVDKTMDLLLTKYLRAGIEYQGIQRVERLPVPEPALREAVLNAIIHKDYGTGVPIQISVYADRLMIWNSGELPMDWTVEKFKGKHHSQPFNPDIANAFFRAGMIEAWGRGIERIFDACRRARVPKPDFRFEATGLWVEFRFPNGGASAPVEVPTVVSRKARAQILVELRRHPESTLAEVAETIGKSVRAVERATAKLVKDGALRYVGSQKDGHWEVLD